MCRLGACHCQRYSLVPDGFFAISEYRLNGTDVGAVSLNAAIITRSKWCGSPEMS